MSEKVFPQLSGYRPLRRRRTATLSKWLDDLNSWKWPAGIAKLTERAVPLTGDSFRSEVMDAILWEVGFRAWRDCFKSQVRLALAGNFDYGDRDEAESVAFMRDQYQAQVAALVASLNQIYGCGSISQAKQIAKAAIASAEGESK